MRQLTNSAGEVTFAKAYDPYGNVTQVNGESHSDFAYTGEQQDAVSGLTYLRARFYSPSTGRFQSRDTWGGNEQRPGTFNGYVYGLNNPLLYTDPSGNFCIAGYDVGTWGDSCTDEQRLQAAENLDYWKGFVKNTNFAIGFEAELLSSMTIVGPELVSKMFTLLLHTQLGATLAAAPSMAYLLGGLVFDPCQVEKVRSSITKIVRQLNDAGNALEGDYYFKAGRVAGRVAAAAVGLGILYQGAVNAVITLPSVIFLDFAGGPSGGATIFVAGAIEGVNAGMVVYGGAVALGVGIREGNDHLVRNFFSDGGGGGNIDSRPLVYGPTSNGKLKAYADEIGGVTLNAYNKPLDQDWFTFSKSMLDKAAESNRRVYFDLRNMKDLKGVLAGTVRQKDITTLELHYILDNWDRFKSIVIFVE